jgi:hypothetical protein
MVGERRLVDQGSDQSQKGQLLRTITGTQKSPEINARYLAVRGPVGLVNHNTAPIRWIAPEKPCVAIGASVELSAICHTRGPLVAGSVLFLLAEAASRSARNLAVRVWSADRSS